jgi:hypothetical protein
MKPAKLEIGVGSQEPGGNRKKEGARKSVFTNMRCFRLDVQYNYSAVL